MSKLKFIVTLLLLVLTAHAEASTIAMPAPENEHSFGLGLEPHWLLLGGIGAKADVRISEKISIGLGGMTVPSYQNTSSSDSNSTSTSYTRSMYEVYLGPTIMLTGDYDHRGIFITPAIGYTGASIKDYSLFKLSGSLDTAELRLTSGYQWVLKNIRFVAGGGYRALNSADVVVKNSSGKEIYRENSSSLGGLVIDAHVAWLF